MTRRKHVEKETLRCPSESLSEHQLYCHGLSQSLRANPELIRHIRPHPSPSFDAVLSELMTAILNKPQNEDKEEHENEERIYKIRIFHWSKLQVGFAIKHLKIRTFSFKILKSNLIKQWDINVQCFDYMTLRKPVICSDLF
jgi:hypothetical protein